MHRQAAYRIASTRITRRKAVLAAGLLAAITFLSSVSAPASAVITPLNTDVLAFSEDFESNPTPRGWTVGDENPYNGTDTWSNTTYRAFNGNSSAWASGAGDHSGRYTLFADGFENWTYSSSVWSFQDRNTTVTQGLDYWGQNQYRQYSGANSIWCAQVGTNYYNGGGTTPNINMHMYDADMNSTALININLAGYSDTQISFWYWSYGEPNWDGLYTAFFDGSWHYENAKNGNQGANWIQSTYNIPAAATMVGFLWTSDSSIDYEGGYIDDVVVSGVRSDTNRDLHRYDDGQSSTMYHPIDLSGYVSGRMDYSYWLDSQAPNDTLQVMYLDGLAWNYVDSHSGSSGGWSGSSVTLPTTVTAIGFRFVSDSAGQREGAYVDNLRVWGAVEPLRCNATAYEGTGMEVVTPFHFGGDAGGGLRPYTFAWSFGDDQTSVLQNPSHFYRHTGDYFPTLRVTDTLGQTCSSATRSIRVTADVTHVFVSPTVASINEGSAITVYGRDGQSDPYPLNWAFTPPECGALSAATGESVLFNAATDAGGSQCTVTGSFGSASSVLKLTILQDTSVIHIAPSGGEVVEGKGLRLSATDRYGGELSFAWTTTCGRVAYGPSSFTFFEAVTEGGVACEVTATYGTDLATVSLSIVHDTSSILVSPTTTSMLEGTTESFSAVDVYHHPFAAEWSVAPTNCGDFAIVTGASTTFTAARDSGGLACTISARAGANHQEIPVAVGHDTSDVTLSPASATVAQGATLAFTFGDRYGHPLSATWSITPSSCGSLDPPSGLSSTLTVAADGGGLTCTVGGTAVGISKFAGVTVEFGAATTVVITAGAAAVIAGSSVPFNAVVKDNVGHRIPGVVVDWTTTCGALSVSSGVSTILAAPASTAGSNCTVSGTYQAISGSASVHVEHAGPFTVTVTPAAPQVSGGGSQQFQATVLDSFGQPVQDATVFWAASCGQLSSSVGQTVTYTAPNGLGGESCRVSASLEVGGAVYESAGTVKTGISTLIILGFVAAGAVVAGLVVVRMRGKRRTDRAVSSLEAPAGSPSSLESLSATAPDAPEAGLGGSLPYAPAGMVTAPSADADSAETSSSSSLCPNCGAATQAGWTTCPECGKDLLGF
jgi:plastocyanin